MHTKALHTLVSFNPVIVNLGCQLNYVRTQLKPKLLGTPERDFIIGLSEARRPTLNLP